MAHESAAAIPVAVQTRARLTAWVAQVAAADLAASQGGDGGKSMAAARNAASQEADKQVANTTTVKQRRHLWAAALA